MGGVGAAAGAGCCPRAGCRCCSALGWLAVAAGAVDVLHHRLPDALTLPALPLALLLLVPLGAEVVLRGWSGAAVAFAAYAAVHLAAPAAMGAGDVKLAAPLGAVLAGVSWEALVVGGLLAALFSGAAGGRAAAVAGPARCARAARPVDAAGRPVAVAVRRRARRRASVRARELPREPWAWAGRVG